MKILVTGGAGFIGSNIVEELVSQNHEVVVLDKFSLGTMINLESVKKKITVIKGDIRDEKTVEKASRGCDIISNQAAASSSPMFKSDLKGSVEINVVGFVNILNAARKNNVRRIVFASTSSIYGNNKPPLREDMKVEPPNFYSATKFNNEHMAKLFSQEYGIETIGFRYMSVYGPHEEPKGNLANLVSQFLWAMKKDESPVIYGNGKQTRDFVFVKDIVQANMLAIDTKKRFFGEIFNVGTGKTTSLNDMITMLNKILQKNIKPKYIPVPIKNYIETQIPDISKIKKELGYSPKYTLEDGIKILAQSK